MSDSFDETYLKVIQTENDIIEEGKMLNSILAGLALYGAGLFADPKIDDSTADVSVKTEMAAQDEETTTIDGKKYKKVVLSRDELKIAKLVYSLTKGYEYSDYDMMTREVNSIIKTIATRYSSTGQQGLVGDMLSKIAAYDFEKYEFKIDSRLTYAIAVYVKRMVTDPLAYSWEDKTIVFFTRKTWKPDEKLKEKYDYKIVYQTANYYYWSIKKKSSNFNYSAMDEDTKFLARVIYAETSDICTPHEVKMVCKVIMNRIGNGDFRNGGPTPKNAVEVVKVKNAFSCINDLSNKNWEEFKPELNDAAKRDCLYAYYMMKNDTSKIKLPENDGDVVYYHDKSIPCPKSWTNKYWKPQLVEETDHFKFYTIIPNKGNSK